MIASFTVFKANLHLSAQRSKMATATIPAHFVPHITVWGSCFSLGSRRGTASASPPPRPPPPHLHHSLTLSLPPSLPPSLTHSQAQYTKPPGRAAARVAAAGAAAAFRVAGAVHRASWTSCRWGRGCLSLDELPLGPRLPFARQAQYTEPPGRAAARVAAAGAAAAFRVAGTVHRASWTSCGAHGRRWGRGCFRVAGAAYHSPLITHHSSHLTHHFSLTILTAHSPLITCPSSFTTHHYTTSHSPLITVSSHLITSQSSQLHYSHLTHHSSTHHHKPSQLHFSHLTYCITTSSQLIKTYHIPAHHSSTSHIFSQLTYHITTHHSSTSHTSLLTPHLSHHNPSHLHFSHHLSHTLFDTPSFTHHLSHTQLCHPPSLTPPPPLSFLTSPSPLQHFWLILGRS